jgi:Protein of unknown function (DUF2785)
LTNTLPVAAILLLVAAQAVAQPCPDVRAAQDRHASALLLANCLGDPDPKVRDQLAFEGLSSLMRSGGLEQRTLTDLKTALLDRLRRPGTTAITGSFSALTLSEIARTDRIKPWMTDTERQELVDTAATFLSGISDYRAFSDKEGFVHAVAHGADFALQLALNPATTKTQLGKLLSAIAVQIAPRNPDVGYWAGEPDRLARAVVFIAQRKLHTDDEWKAWFVTVMDPKPIASWDVAFTSEIGIRRHHNVRAFLLSVFASATTAEDAGIRQLISPTRDALKLVP